MFRYIVMALACLSATTLMGGQESTLVLIKPNAVTNKHVGDILKHFEGKDLRLQGLKMVQLSVKDASRFYAIHESKPFFGDLVRYMSEGPIVAIVLGGDDAVQRTRTLIGATDPKKASEGTLRALFGESVTKNALHSSDSPVSAAAEIPFFFAGMELSAK